MDHRPTYYQGGNNIQKVLKRDLHTQRVITMNYNPKIGKSFRPEPQFKTLYYIYLLLALVFCVLTWFIPVMLFVPFVITAFIFVPIVIIVVFVIYWIPLYYKTMQYTLTEDEITWQRGVWFKKTGIVPHNRITNVDMSQGPVSRMLGIAFLKVQTAGYSAPSGSGGGAAELRIEGVRQYEELQNVIMEFVRGKKPVAVETYERDTVLEELVKIRKLLETMQR